MGLDTVLQTRKEPEVATDGESQRHHIWTGADQRGILWLKVPIHGDSRIQKVFELASRCHLGNLIDAIAGRGTIIPPWK